MTNGGFAKWRAGTGISLALISLLALADPSDAAVQAGPAVAERPTAEAQDSAGERLPQDAAASAHDSVEPSDASLAVEEAIEDDGSTDIFSRNTLYVLLDGRVVLADGHESWINGGLGKTRFQGTADGDFKLRAVPAEAIIVWAPQFSGALSANVSAGWQHNQDNDFDLVEAFVTLLPPQTGTVNFSARAGLMWPEISLEHSTGGGWNVVNTITPSAINSWVGEEVKVLGAEATASANLKQHHLALTGGLFGYNDTSGTLLSFRGWALHDVKATAFGYFELPPFNEFISHLQEHRTRSLLEIDDRAGFYARLGWRPPMPFGLSVFYYDNRGDPEAFTPAGQWGWRTRFWNIGFDADLGPHTRLVSQAMTGTTKMGFRTNDVIWVDTRFRSAYVLVTHAIGKGAITGRLELFETKERGSQMVPEDENEDGWALTAAGRWSITDSLTAFIEALHVRSDRGARRHIGLSQGESQTVVQASLRFRL